MPNRLLLNKLIRLLFVGYFQALKNWLLKYDVYCLMGLALLLRVFGRGSSSYGVIGELYRDLNVVYNFLHFHRWPLLGPSSSLGGFNFGAIYYYLLTPFVWLFGLAPYGATFVSLLFSVLSIFMLYRLLCLWFPNTIVARLGALLLAVSVLDIQNSYYISNPNIMPFFILWSLYCLTQVVSSSRSWRYFIGLGISLGVVTQLHATALLLLPAVVALALFWRRKFVANGRLALAAALALLLYSPYIVYESRHHLANTLGILHLGQKNFGLIVKWNSVLSIAAFWQSWLIARAGFFDFLQLQPGWSILFLVALVGCIVWLMAVAKILDFRGKFRAFLKTSGGIIMALWLVLGTLMFLFFQQPIQQFYFFVLWPLPLIILAWLISVLWDAVPALALSLLVIFCAAQAWQLRYFYPITWQSAFDHRALLEDFAFVKQRAQGQSYSISNDALDVNQFYYYETITHTSEAVTKVNAARLFAVCPQNERANCQSSGGLHYVKVDEWQNNGLFIIMYQKR